MRFVALKPSTMIGKSVMQKFGENVSFISFVRLRMRSYPDSDEVATLALSSSKNIPNSKLFRWFKYIMFRAQYNWARTFFSNNPGVGAFCWNGLNGSRRAFVEGAGRAGASVVFFEAAPLPGRITIDTKGVNFANSLPRNSQFYTDWQAKNSQHLDAWLEVRDSIVSRQSSGNKNVKQLAVSDSSLHKPYLFVPLQVQSDTQIKIFGGLIKSVDHFIRILDECATLLPSGWHLRVKEHPSSTMPYGLEGLIKNSERWIIDNATDTMQLVKQSKGVVTVNSSVGLEALFFGRPVIVVGQAFYGIENIAHSIKNESELHRFVRDPNAELKFQEREVTAFLNYLSVVYYPKVEMVGGVVNSIDAAWVNAFKGRMRMAAAGCA